MALAYGFHDLETLKANRIQDIGITETNERVQTWSAEVNRTFDAIFNTFSVRNEMWNKMPIIKYNLPASTMAQFVDEHGVADARVEEGYIQQGLPLMRYEDALGFTYESLAKATVEEYSRQLDRVQRADMTAAIHLFLFACLYDTNWTFKSKEAALPDIDVKAAANGDTDEYTLRGSGAPSTADHYLAQAASIDDANDPFPTIKETLTRYGNTSPNDRVVVFVGDATNASAIKALSGFHRVDRTKLTHWGDNVSLVDPSADTFLGMGDEVLGEHEEGIVVVRWRRLPDNYLLAFNLDVDGPIGIREDETPALRGLFNITAVENSGNNLLSRWRRKIGMAPVNRVGLLAYRIGNASYAAPSPYDSIPG